MPIGPDPDGIVDALVDAGVLAPGERASLEPLAGGVSADVFLIITGAGRRLVAKRSLHRLRVVEEWLAPTERMSDEVAWLRVAREIDPRLAPEVLAEIPGQSMFVMAFLDPATHPVWKAELAQGRVDPAFGAAVGRDLARIHRATAHRDDLARRFGDDTGFFALRISPFLLRAAERHPDAAPRLHAMADDLRERRTALVHGDVSPKNILVGPQGPVFIDAETCVFGDPAFDFAFCLSHLLLKTVWLPHSLPALEATLEAFAVTYRAAVDWEDAPALSERAAALAAALLLARVDGKSPAPYLTDPADKAFVRAQAKRLIAAEGLTLGSLWAQWRSALEQTPIERTPSFGDDLL
jgi:aminoglycoside phosphotransferase (APT) family kinase protein